MLYTIRLEVCVQFHWLWLVTISNFSFCGMKIYIAPSKALVQEKLHHWSQKFGSWGVNCLELTGDNESYSLKNVQEADIILTTPEVKLEFLFMTYALHLHSMYDGLISDMAKRVFFL